MLSKHSALLCRRAPASAAALRLSLLSIAHGQRSTHTAKQSVKELFLNKAQVKETKLFINNEFVNSISGKTFPVINPATEEVICEVQEALQADVDVAVKAANVAFESSKWRDIGGTGRRDLLNKLADLFEKHSAELAALESLNNGKPYSQKNGYGSETDLQLSVKCLRYYAGWADKIQGKTVPMEGNFFCYTLHEAIGPVGQIIPWNFPLLMLAWKLGPALAAGCTVVMKTSEKTPLSALYVAHLIREAGFPPGVVNILSGYGHTAGQAIARHMDLVKVAFTGSTGVGKQLLKYAAESNLKRVTLELGGKSPLIVLEDADVEEAVNIAQVGLFLNQGQCCVASSRLFVHEKVYDKFVALAAEKASARVVGDPFDAKTQQGPQVDGVQFNKILGMIEKGKAEGARLVAGGSRVGNKGFFVAPTVFADVKDDMTIAREEIFGPVMSILKFSSLDEVVQRANASPYGLAAGVVTKNIGHALRLSRELRAGTVWVNTYDNFDAAAPFGGYKESGWGREKGEYGLDSYLEVKSVIMPSQ